MKQTAVEWLVKKYFEDYNVLISELEFQQAKEMEEQQLGYSEEDMLKSFIAGIKCESNNGKNFEQFIKQFKNK